MENLTLGKLVSEIAPEVVGRRVERVSGSPPLSFHLELVGTSKNDPLVLTFSLDPRFPFLLTLDTPRGDVSAGRLEIRSGNSSYVLSDVPADALPEGFVRTMKSSLSGALVAGIGQFNRDRVVRTSFSRNGREIHAVLWAELFGRRPNAVLVKSPGDSILACSREGVASAAGTLLRPGEIYTPPSEENRTDVETLSSDALRALVQECEPETLGLRLSRKIKGLSPQAASRMVEEVTASSGPPTPEILLAGLKEALLGGDERLRLTVRTAINTPAGQSMAPERGRSLKDSPSPDEDATRHARPGAPARLAAVPGFDLVLFPLGAGLSCKEKGFATKDFATASEAVRFVFFHLCRWYRTSSAFRIRKHAHSLLERLEKLRVSLLGDMASAERAEHYRKMGELILANLKTVERGSTVLEVSDIHSDGKARISVELDPSLPPLHNAERYFKRARKAERALGRVRGRLAAVEHAAEAIRTFADTIEAETSSADAARLTQKLNLLVRRLRARKTLDVPPLTLFPAAPDPARRGSPSPGEAAGPKRRTARRATSREEKPGSDRRSTSGQRVGGRGRLPVNHEGTTFNPRLFETSDGFALIVGRNNKENDYITHRLARPEDLWFHASGMPGSHVILKARGKSAPSRTAIREAASVAAYFSKGRTSSAVPVIYTKRKYVRKPKGSRPGVATYVREEFIMARPVKPGLSS